MSVEDVRKSALARLKSPTGYVSAELPEKLELNNEIVFPKQILKAHRQKEIDEKERSRLLELLKLFVENAILRIENASDAEEVKRVLEEGVGAKRLMKILETDSEMDTMAGKVEDAKRWLSFSKEIKG
ncbi:MAG: DUF5788 family protein [Candidatus Thermoplasmatota archaeon]|nr:DUF5788 family protein [Candidatus Thermoplasmatota archaeon]